jgi:hypothetical protein
MNHAITQVMQGAQRFDELLTWQRMHELNVEVWRLADRPLVARDFKFRDQITDAADSAERNVAEGFAPYNPGEFCSLSRYLTRLCDRGAHLPA